MILPEEIRRNNYINHNGVLHLVDSVSKDVVTARPILNRLCTCKTPEDAHLCTHSCQNGEKIEDLVYLEHSEINPVKMDGFWMNRFALYHISINGFMIAESKFGPEVYSVFLEDRELFRLQGVHHLQNVYIDFCLTKLI